MLPTLYALAVSSLLAGTATLLLSGPITDAGRGRMDVELLTACTESHTKASGMLAPRYDIRCGGTA
jgi:hypothetical protein